MDSDSGDLSSVPDDVNPIPSDAIIEKALCDAVVACFTSGDLDSLTLKRIRISVTEKLKLPGDFLKTDSRWKDKSKEIVNTEVSRQEATSPHPPSSPGATKKSATPFKSTAASKAKKDRKPKPAAKRKSSDKAAPPKKRRKATPPSESDKNSPLSSPSKSDLDSIDSEEEEVVKKLYKTKTKPLPKSTSTAEDDLSDSDLSSVIDDAPPSKTKRKKSISVDNQKTAKPKITKPKTPAKESTTQEDEIKRLQSWLVKCGIRKLWGKELAPYTTPREKISHLKKMLTNAGMGSRYSEEKARQIRDERELKADLEDIVERERKWGQSDEDDDGGIGDRGPAKPKRRLARGLKELQVFADDEESSE